MKTLGDPLPCPGMGAPLLAAVVMAFIAPPLLAGSVTLPFADDFNDTDVGDWVQNNGTYTHNGSTLNVVAGSNVGGATVEVPELGGAATVDFTASVVLDPTTNTTAGFGLLSSNSSFGAANNTYYLVDIAPDSGGRIRIAQINITGSGGVTIGDTGLQTAAISYSSSEVYTLTVAGTYGAGGLTLDYTVTSTGGDNVNLVVTDPTPLTGQHFGIETFNGQTVVFDNFSLTPTGAAADPDLVVLATPEDVLVIGSSGTATTSATIRNDGASSTLTGTASVSGTGFSLTSPTAINLAPGASQTITIQFDASAVPLDMVQHGTLTLATNDPVEPSVELDFTGLASSTGLVAYESFESEAIGAFDGTAGRLWILGSSDEQIVSEDLSYGNGPVSVGGGNRSLRVSSASANPLGGFAFSAQSGTIYFSFLTKVADAHFFQLGLTAGYTLITTNSASLAIDTRSTPDTATARLYGNTESSKVGSSDLGYANGDILFVVGRLSKDGSANYNKLDLKLNPGSLNEPGTWDASLAADLQTGSMDHFVLRLFDSTASEYAWLDEFRIGLSYSAVVPNGIAPDPVLSQDVANGDPDLDFGTVPGSGPFSEARTVRFVNNGPTNGIGISAASVSGDPAYSLAAIAINGSTGVSLPQALAVGDYIDFTVAATLTAPASGVTGSLVIDTDAAGQDKNLPITGSFGVSPTLPAVTNDAPAAGKRVRVTAPGSGYEGNSNVYHTLYLPPDWEPGRKYPVIVEYAPNLYPGFAGTPDDTHLGFYQSGGTGYIWASMPCIHENSTPGDKSDDYIATTWYGAGKDDDAAYTMAAVSDIIENYGGDHACVLVTGFSRGAIACGELGCLNDAMADIWLAFLPHSHTDAGWYATSADSRTDRIMGRSTFITYGQSDSGATNSKKGVDALNARSFPVESYELAGTTHTDEWITDASTPVASSASYTGHPLVVDVRARMRNWMSGVIANKPGTHSISGLTTDASGNPIAGVRVRSGLTHWTFTDATGAYELAGLIDGNRTVTVSHPSHQWSPDTLNVILAGADLARQDFQATTAFPFAITGVSWDEVGDFIIDFTGPPNSSFEVRKSLDMKLSPFPTAVTPRNAPVTTNGAGVGRAVIHAADAAGPAGFFQIVQP